MAATTSFSSQVFITSKKSSPRLFILTGKGGTGKTTLAQALTLALQNKKKKIFYVAFDQTTDTKTCRDLKIPFFVQVQKDITLEYVTDKLGSRIVANWILETAFFKALYQMLPGIIYLILISDILKRLEEDQNLHIVLDLPSSGHALTLFEAPHNFKALFERGPLFEDLKRIQRDLLNPKETKLYICSLATELSYNEAQELKEQLIELEVSEPEIIFNNSLAALDLDEKKLPPILKKKVKQENKVLTMGKDEGIKTVFPFIAQARNKDRIEALTQEWSEQ